MTTVPSAREYATAPDPCHVHSKIVTWKFDSRSPREVLAAAKEAMEKFDEFEVETVAEDHIVGYHVTPMCKWRDEVVIAVASDGDNGTVAEARGSSTSCCCGPCPNIIKILFCWCQLYSDNGMNIAKLEKLRLYIESYAPGSTM